MHHFSLDVKEKHPAEDALGMGLWEELYVGMISAWMGKGDIPQRIFWEPQAPFLPEFVRETSHIKCTGHGFFGRSFL